MAQKLAMGQPVKYGSQPLTNFDHTKMGIAFEPYLNFKTCRFCSGKSASPPFRPRASGMPQLRRFRRASSAAFF